MTGPNERGGRVHDIAIVGGGAVGLSMAAGLVQALPGLDLALVEKGTAPRPDARASAIAAGGRNLFQALGVWSELAEAANPIARMKITDSRQGDLARPLFLDFAGEVAPGEPFAHMVPNARLLATLEAVLATHAVTRVQAGVTALSERERASAVLGLDTGERVCARLVIAADGGQSKLRGLAGINAYAHAYAQSGLAVTIAHGLPHDDTAYEHFRPAGPFASLPLRGQRSSLVWTESPARAETLVGMDQQDLCREIEAVMGSSLGKVTLEGPVQRFPLSLRLAHSFSSARVALIGDAAHVIHPIAGQGLNLGLKDVAALVEVLADAMRTGRDPGSRDVLEHYTRWRRYDTALMAMATDGLNRLFSNDVPPLRALRDLGLSVVDRIEPFKSGLIGRAAGADGPRLLRGEPV